MSCRLGSDERELINELKEELDIHCERCHKKLGWNIPVSHDYDYQWYHLTCAYEFWRFKCERCGALYSEAEDYGEDFACCDECGEKGKLVKIKNRRKELQKALERTTLTKHYNEDDYGW